MGLWRDRLIEDIKKEFGTVLKSEISLRALQHIITRAEKFNRQPFPCTIMEIGIGGSSIRVEEPNDIDISLSVYEIAEKKDEWDKFIKCVNSNIYNLSDLAYEISYEEGRATVEKLINRKKSLIKLGFKECWINNWMPHFRITDIRKGLNLGMPFTFFSIDELISRYIKSGWSRKRIEMHINPYGSTRNKTSVQDEVPFITVWNINEGVMRFNNGQINKFLKEENKVLKSLSKKIDKVIERKDNASFRGLPNIYNPSLSLFMLEYKGRFPKFYKEIRKKTLIEAAKIDKILKCKNDDLDTINTNLRNSLKKFALIGLVLDRIECTDFVYDKVSKNSIESEQWIREGLIKRLRRYGYPKKGIENVLNIIDFNSLLDDLETIKKEC